jgi:hypothetical protein
MKKVFLTFAIAAVSAVALTSCGGSNNAAKEEETVDEGANIQALIENCSNNDSLQVYAEQAQAYAAKLEAEGKTEEAQAYLQTLATVVEQKDPTAVNIIDLLKSAAQAKANEVVTDVKEGVDESVDAVTDAAATAATSAAAAGKQTVDNAVQAGKDKVDATVQAGKSAVDNAAQKGKNAVDNATQKGKDAVSNATQNAANKVINSLNK